MARYLTAIEAARRLGKTERTVRRWIESGRLAAFHPRGQKNRLAIAESDVEQLAQELAQYGEQEAPGEHGQDIAALVARIEKLEQEVSELRAALAGVTSPAAQAPLTYEPVYHDTLIREQRAPGKGRPAGVSATSVAPADIPPGSILYKDFAERHGIKARTFRDQITSAQVAAITIPKPNRPGELERWLTPDQQRAAIDYWRSRNASIMQPCGYADCIVCSPASGESSESEP